jgi:hypothetical protein
MWILNPKPFIGLYKTLLIKLIETHQDIQL